MEVARVYPRVTRHEPLTPICDKQHNMTTTPRVAIFTDGAARGNPGRAGWGAIVCTPAGEVTELGGHAPKATNNQMELTAAVEGLREARRAGASELALYSDSTYVLQGISSWIHGWKRRGWRKRDGNPVLNAELWQALDAAREGVDVTYHYLKGHAGVPANEQADTLACRFADDGPEAESILYRGPLADYGVALFDLPDDTSVPSRSDSKSKGGKASGKGKSKGKPYCYLSVVGGVLETHDSWPACEARVKGTSGARFKKAMSRDEAEQIARGWGHRLP